MAKSNNVYKDAYNKGLGLLETTGNLPSEPELGAMLGVSRTTVRSILARMEETGLIEWNKREKKVLRAPGADDFFPDEETDSLSQIIERSFMRRLLASGAAAGTQINELELAREIGVGTTSVREFLIRFSRFGLIEKRRNSHWVLKGFNRAFALELTEIREMFELRSAAAFVDLPDDNPVWAELDRLEAEHRRLASEIATRFTEFSELDERLHRVIHSASHNRFNRRLLRRHRHDLPLPLSMEQGRRASAQRGRGAGAFGLYRRAEIPRCRKDRRGLPAASELGTPHAAHIGARSGGRILIGEANVHG